MANNREWYNLVVISQGGKLFFFAMGWCGMISLKKYANGLCYPSSQDGAGHFVLPSNIYGKVLFTFAIRLRKKDCPVQ